MTRLRLYKDTKIKQDKNFMFDDIEDYLSNYEYKIFEVQYQKQEREIFLKIVLEQIYANSLKENSYNYAVIDNEGEESSYYFISDITWTAYNTCKLHLTLDILNTFKLGKHYELTDKTRVFREHKDRLRTVDRIYTTYVDASKPYDNYKYFKIFVPGTYDSASCDCELIFEHNGYIYERKHFDFLEALNVNGTYILRLKEGSNVIFEGLECIIYASDLSKFGMPLPTARDFLDVLSAKKYRLAKSLIRNIEKESEDFNATLYHNTEEDKIIEDSKNDLKWNLLYINRDDISETNINNPVLCKLYPSKKIYINSDTFLLTQNNMPVNKFMNISILENPNFKIQVKRYNETRNLNSTIYKSVSFKFIENNKVEVVLFKNDASPVINPETFSPFEIVCENVEKIRISENSLNQNTTLTDLEALPLDTRFIEGHMLVEDENYIK